MTPNKLLKSLENLPANLPVVFITKGTEIGAGYHITELKYAAIVGIDCGGSISSSTQSYLQLLDGQGEIHMAAGKMATILKQSVERLNDLGPTPLKVEFSPGNVSLVIYDLETPRLENNRIVIDLKDTRSFCKPAVDAKANNKNPSCCGPVKTKTACC